MSGVPGGAWSTLPAAIIEQQAALAAAALGARVAGATMPDKAVPGESRRMPSGREASGPHTARLRPGRGEFVLRGDVWAELERGGVTLASVRFSGRAGAGGWVQTIALRSVHGDRLVEVERWCGREELVFALEAPVWDRFGWFAGRPWVRGAVCWTLADRSVVIVGVRGHDRFEEAVA